MGNCCGKNGATTVSSFAQPNEDTRLIIRLKGDIGSISMNKIQLRLCEVCEEYSNRFEVEPGPSESAFFVRVKAIKDDPPGTVNGICQRIIGLAGGKGIAVSDITKIVRAKVYLEAGEMAGDA